MSIDDSKLLAHLSSLPSSAARPELHRVVLPTLLRSISAISHTLQSASRVAAVGSSNAFGDEQLNVDVLAEQLIRSGIRDCASIATASSEEDPVERPAREAGVNSIGGGSDAATDTITATASNSGHGAETYTVAFDPLDGSSIIAPNWTVGTIVGVWDGASALGDVPAQKQVAAVLGVYGPRTTAVVAVRVPGAAPACFEVAFSVGSDGQGDATVACEVVRPRFDMLAPPFATRYFAPANLRAAAEDERYLGLVTHYVKEKYTLRYSGGLVPDVVHALVKGHGVYVSPVTATSKAKLRRLYELAPIALVMECVGAMAVDPSTGLDVLATPIADCDERAGLVCGTREEVEFVKRSFGL